MESGEYTVVEILFYYKFPIVMVYFNPQPIERHMTRYDKHQNYEYISANFEQHKY